MDETRKKYIIAGVVVGAVAVGLTILARKTPRDQWGSTLLKITKDGLSVVKDRYGNNELIGMVEKTIDRFHDGTGKLLHGDA